MSYMSALSGIEIDRSEFRFGAGKAPRIGQMLTSVNNWYGEANQCFSRHSVN
jgi:hypothetical protein